MSSPNAAWYADFEKFTAARAIVAKPDNPTVPRVRAAKPKKSVDDDDEKGNTMAKYDLSRGPFHAILDKMARARQGITGESYAKAFTETYCDPKNAAIRDGAKHDDLAKAFDSVHGTAKSLVKAAPPEPPQDDPSPGPAHDDLNERVMTRMKNEPKLSYQQAFTREYLHPDNRSLKSRVDAESILHAQRLAPAPPFPAYARG